MTGTVGTVAVTAGPGLTNTVTAIKNAQMAESPILLLGLLFLSPSCLQNTKLKNQFTLKVVQQQQY